MSLQQLSSLVKSKDQRVTAYEQLLHHHQTKPDDTIILSQSFGRIDNLIGDAVRYRARDKEYISLFVNGEIKRTVIVRKPGE